MEISDDTLRTIRMLLPVLAVLIGVAGSFFAWRLRKASESWPVTEGTILYGQARHEKGEGHIAEMTYTFSIAGERYTGSYIHKAESEATADEYARAMRDRKVKVRYKPEQPDTSFGTPVLQED